MNRKAAYRAAAPDSGRGAVGAIRIHVVRPPRVTPPLDRLENMSRDPVEEIVQHLDKTDDPVLVILRAHLLVEERLRDILARLSRAPDELKAARLSFHQVLYLCRAIIARHDEPVWDFMARLNEARNRIAHHLDPGDFDEILGAVAAELGAYYADRLRTPLDRFRTAVIYTCGYLESIGGGLRLRQAYADEGEV